MASLALDNISKSFGATDILKHISLEIRDGEFLTLVGPSGCGKSTLLRIIAGLELQDEGTVRIGARAVDALPPKARNIAMVFQSYALYPHMTVERNMAVPLVMSRLSATQRLPLLGHFVPGTKTKRAGIAAEVRNVAAALGIEQLLARKPGQLSGGQRQRVALGRAMVRQPSVFLMDEPLSNLDAKLRVTMRAEIKELHARLGVTFVYVTHDQAEAMTMSDRVALMMGGELIQIAPPQVLYDDPNNVGVAAFVGSPSINLVPADALGERIEAVVRCHVDGGSLDGITVGLRPEALSARAEWTPGAIAGRVRFVEHLGADLYVHVDIASAQRPLIIRAHPKDGPNLAPGASVALQAELKDLLVFDGAGRRLRRRPPDVVELVSARSGA
ncbi:fused maltose transport subunit, ATP-binding component of ABC superfamily [Bradyrhizobium oligotrophicum S58]|uniref:Fused maltose transport subunit, ATP-binding component of ABC superfamily n=1 Tax=Bradyrhizobium oligotrophicum S58 TaxID=1245469 RepID=M4Z2J0_9BRAD|nr:ABC transporter ATP-binding protein [Bradyrhizobium oligotrophicum]BAM86972.1 fused maltose transport subunit, ATP-binding component of ABC superfamily [Bradyrhizobium oligotrophicum S58]